ncbi:hypothetical protein ACWOF5_13715 [Carnobacterium divergens]
MYYELILNTKNVRFLKRAFLLLIVIVPIASIFDQLLPTLMVYSGLVLYRFLESKSTLQFYEDKIIYNTIIRKRIYSKENHKIKFGGTRTSLGEDQTTYYLVNIVSKPGYKIVKEIPMSMTKNDYNEACKKLTELKEI